MANISRNTVVDPGRLMEAIGGNAAHPENIEGTSDKQKSLQK